MSYFFDLCRWIPCGKGVAITVKRTVVFYCIRYSGFSLHNGLVKIPDGEGFDEDLKRIIAIAEPKLLIHWSLQLNSIPDVVGTSSQNSFKHFQAPNSLAHLPNDTILR